MGTGVDVVRGEKRLRGRLSPLRRRLLEELREPASASELAARLGEGRQRVNYHLRELEKGGLVELVELRPRRGFTERVLRATAGAVVVAPEVAGDLTGVAQDRYAVDMLLASAARALGDVAAMREQADAAGKRLITFTIEAEVGFERPADIERFAEELAAAVAELATRYDSPRRRYRIAVGGYPASRASKESR